MKPWLKITLLILIAILVIIQFFQTDHSNPPVTAEIDAPPAVMAVLRESCYDCHSNETDWPWYSYVNPVGWLVGDDVHHGREHFNFSEWQSYDAQKQYHIREEIMEVTQSGEMPLPIYLLMHGDAELTDEDHAVLKRWISEDGTAQEAAGSESEHEEDHQH